jgi:hypothetical protein
LGSVIQLQHNLRGGYGWDFLSHLLGQPVARVGGPVKNDFDRAEF